MSVNFNLELDRELEQWLAETDGPPLLEVDFENESSLADLLQDVETLEAEAGVTVAPSATRNHGPGEPPRKNLDLGLKKKPGPRKPDPKNAERCRRLRQRRKETLEKERQANIELKRDRHSLLTKIAELEMEVQGLRGRNAVNLAKENQLLAVQVKRYKQYVSRIVDLTRDVSLPEKEEALVALRTGVTNSVGQVIGLAYSSLVDKSWNKGEDWELPGGIEAKAWSQTLPVGASLQEATQLNIRVDMLNIMRSASEVTTVLKRGNMDLEGIQEFYGDCTMCLNNTYKLLYSSKDESGALQAAGDDEVNLWQTTTQTTPKRELLYASSCSKAVVYPSAFQDKNLTDSLQPHDVRVIVNTTTGTTQDGGSSSHLQAETKKGTWVEGWIVRETEDVPSSLVYIMSLPLDPEFVLSVCPGGVILPNEKGEFSADAKQFFEHQAKLFLS